MAELETKELLANVATGIETVQKRLDDHGKKLDVIDNDVIVKATKDATDALEGIQLVKQKQTADDNERKELLTQIQDLEKVVAKGGTVDGQENPAYKNAIAMYMRKGTGIDGELNDSECREIIMKRITGATDNEKEMLVKDMLEGSGPDGGYWLQNDRASFISKRIFESSPLRSVARVVNTTSDIFEVVLDDDEFAAGWVGETTSRTDTDTAEIGLVKIPIQEVYAQPRATQRMLDDAGFNLEGWITEKAAAKIGRVENTAGVVGDGAEKWKGFLAYSAWASAGVYERNKVEQIAATGTAGSLTAGDDLIALQNSLIESYQQNAAWAMKRATFGSVMKLKDSQGQYILHSRFLSENAEKVLLGSPVVLMNDMPAVAANALAIAYADFSEFYTIADRFGIRILRDPYTSKPYVRFYTTKRSGAAVTNFEAGKILKINA